MTLRFVPNNLFKKTNFRHTLLNISHYFQVFSKGPDDKLYNERQDLREKVARGNTILYVHNLETNVMHYDGVVFALRKFTGNSQWARKFKKSPGQKTW